MNLNITGRVALVTGSSTGLGFAIARGLAAEGCRVALNGRDPQRLERAVNLVRDRAATAEGFPADVSVPADAERLVDRVRHRFGSVDILVCNAGGPPAASFENLTAEHWRGALELNLLSTVHLCRATVPLMRARQWGRVICLTSVAAKQPLPGLMLSSSARAGVLGFAKALADETAPEGITVNVVCPGYMHTQRTEELVERRAHLEKRSSNEVLKSLVLEIPMGRMGDPDELAAAVAFLASESAGYITGAAIQVDGGFVRSII